MRIKLPLLPGLRWTGHLVVIGRTDEGYIVDFDAINPSAPASARHVMDRGVLSPDLLHDWTGTRDPQKKA